MVNWVVQFITQVFQVALVASIIGLSCYSAYLIYKKRENNNSMGIEDNTTGIVRRLVQFATFIANKLKEK